MRRTEARLAIVSGSVLESGATSAAPAPPRLEARDVSVRVGTGPLRVSFVGPSFLVRDQTRRQILAKTSLSLEPGELIALVGSSGSGKTTLLRALAGITRPSSGAVLVDGRPVSSLRRDIGYLPQNEIVHERLSVAEALRYAARLRMPAGTSRAEMDAAVAQALRDMELEKRARIRIESLSGGERKRVGVGIELLSRPSLLFLDEPTTGLDPGIESRMMALLRGLATGPRTIVVATHATKSLSVCDKLAVIGHGGHLAYYGPPGRATAFFGVSSYDDIYAALDRRPAHRWRRQGAAQGETGEPNVEGNGGSATARLEASPPPRSGRRRGALAQAVVLSGRYARLFARDRRNFLLLVGQVPIIAVAIVSVFESGILNRPPGGDPQKSVELLFALVTAAVWLGSIDAAREVVKERSVLDREGAIGVRRLSYLASKLVVLFALAAVQMALLCGIIFALIPPDEPRATIAVMYGVLTLTSWVAIAMGLLVSAAATSEDQATSVIPLTLIPQLLFTGALVPVAAMHPVVAKLSGLAFGQWTFASLGTAVDMKARIAGEIDAESGVNLSALSALGPETAARVRDFRAEQLSRVNEFGPTFFSIPQLDAYAILGGFLAVLLVGALLLLRPRS
ncbi:MAG: ATP-binding cassette domain-containing protein [Thermoleophilaceae bacterium]